MFGFLWFQMTFLPLVGIENLQVAATSRNQEEHEQQKREHRREGTGVSSEQQQHQQQQWIALSLPLQIFHYSNGQLTLRCNAQIPGIYSSMNELQLGAGLREPVPERVCWLKNLSLGMGFRKQRVYISKVISKIWESVFKSDYYTEYNLNYTLATICNEPFSHSLSSFKKYEL
ncbi:platelet endothelial cell adhesion molecule-like isoform X1 [Vespula squamosa]|uniref:Platelet endothelial cell adhesion molecule-like isoform X1 n=1 Tax=Vespula squamosa TaxID=30214 RepID=A0ABD1ZTY1_VESSQ